MKIKASLILTVAALALSGSALAEVKIAPVAKSLGNGFFEAANVGAQEAAKELGDVKVIYTGPTTTTAEAQIEVLNGLIARGVDAIAISANDPDAVVPVLKKRCSAASRLCRGIPAWRKPGVRSISTRPITP